MGIDNETKTNNINPSKIIGIQFSVLSPEEIRNSSVAEITSRDTYINNKPVIGGLFDPRMGVLDAGLICPTDGHNYMKTPGYFGHIELAKPVFYIQYIEPIKKILRCVCIKCGKLKISKEKHKHCLKMAPRKRWHYVFHEANKVRRCGEETADGCGAKQPKKIQKQDLASIFATWESSDGITDSEGQVTDKPTMRLTPELVLKIFRRISDEDITFMGFSPLWSRPEWFVCQTLAVPPPSVRPSVKHDAQQRSEDDISHIIVNIIKANNTLQSKIEKNANTKVIEDWATVLQYYVATMIDNRIPGVASVAQRSGRALKSIKERLVGKQGRVRGNLMGKRVDFSARSVITPDANIDIDELGVPVKIAMNITVPTTVNKRNINYLTKLIRNGPDTYPGANILKRKAGHEQSLRHSDRNNIELRIGDIVQRHLMNGDPILFNRQPTLHRMSMMCHKVKVMRVGSTFRLNVAVTKPYNADFDGDEMNLHGPQDEESAAELLYLAAVPRQIISPANNKSVIGIFQDSLLGCYRFTRKGIDFSKRTAMNLLMYHKNPELDLFKKKDRISSFEIMSQILPPLSLKTPNGSFDKSTQDAKTTNNIIDIINGKYLRGQIDKKILGAGSKGLIQSIFNDYSFKDSANFINDIQAIATEYMKLTSYSVGISDLIADDNTNGKIDTAIKQKKKEVGDLMNQLHLSIFENNTGKTNEVEFETQVNALLNKASENAGNIGKKSLSKDNRFIMMVNAGSKGSNINIAQMISCVGQQNVDGKRIPYGFEDRTLPHYNKYDDSPEARGFVQSSFIGGLTPEEVYFHAMGGRTGLIDTAVKTSQTGYIQRRLIKGLEDLKVCYDMTVRNNKNKIIQFKYGDDNIVTTRCETQSLPIVSMTLEELYSHYHIPTDTKNSISSPKLIYNSDALKRFKKQKTELKKYNKNRLKYIIEKRDDIATHVFKQRNEQNIHIPVNFKRIINNIKHNLNIKATFTTDITPLEFYKMIDHEYSNLELNRYTTPTELFKVAYYFQLTAKEILIVNRFSKAAVIILLNKIKNAYLKSLVHPGEMVGMIGAQSIGEPTTQMTLNTFHFAGVASKSNVTRGLPRIEEILSLSENPKQPSTTIRLKSNEHTDPQKAQELKYSLEYCNLKDIVNSLSICFDPQIGDTNIDEDKKIVEQFYEFEKIMNDSGVKSDDNKLSKWIIRLKLNRDEMLDKQISMDDIHFAVKNCLKQKTVQCIYSDFNDDNLIFRIRLVEALLNKKEKPLDQTDEIYKLKNFQENLLKNIILKGVKKIPKIIIRKVTNNVEPESGNYVPTDVWCLDTVGTNLKEILAIPSIDPNKTTSNHIQEIQSILGIEAARQSIYNELEENFEANGTYINYHHMALLSDRMCATLKMVSIFRHGINNDDIGPIAKASFEETPEMFLRAARHAELDLMTGVSSNVMCGQEGYFGTNSFQVLLDINKMNKIGDIKINEQINIQNSLNLEDNTDPCSKNNIIINDSVDNINANNTGDVDDDYDIGL